MFSVFLSEEKEENQENKLSVTFGYYSAGTNSLMQNFIFFIFLFFFVFVFVLFSAKDPLK